MARPRRLTSPGSTTGSHSLGAGLHVELLGTGDGASPSCHLCLLPPGRRAQACCTRVRTCTQLTRVRTDGRHTHSLVTPGLPTGGGRRPVPRTGAPDRTQDPVCCRHGVLVAPVGRRHHACEHREGSPSGCCPRPGGGLAPGSWARRAPHCGARGCLGPRRLCLSSRQGKWSGERAVVARAHKVGTRPPRAAAATGAPSQGAGPGPCRNGLAGQLGARGGGPMPSSLMGRSRGPQGRTGGHREASRSLLKTGFVWPCEGGGVGRGRACPGPWGLGPQFFQVAATAEGPLPHGSHRRGTARPVEGRPLSVCGRSPWRRGRRRPGPAGSVWGRSPWRPLFVSMLPCVGFQTSFSQLRRPDGPDGTLLSLLLPRQRRRPATAPAGPPEILISPASACTAERPRRRVPTTLCPSILPVCSRPAQVERPGPRGPGVVGVPATHTPVCWVLWVPGGTRGRRLNRSGRSWGGSLGPVCHQPAPFLPHTPCLSRTRPEPSRAGSWDSRPEPSAWSADAVPRRPAAAGEVPQDSAVVGWGCPQEGQARAGRAVCAVMSETVAGTELTLPHAASARGLSCPASRQARGHSGSARPCGLVLCGALSCSQRQYEPLHWVAWRICGRGSRPQRTGILAAQLPLPDEGWVPVHDGLLRRGPSPNTQKWLQRPRCSCPLQPPAGPRPAPATARVAVRRGWGGGSCPPRASPAPDTCTKLGGH